MRKIIVILILLAVLMVSSTFYGCSKNNNSEFIRIHIRANSNEDRDQSVKYLIKDKICEYIQPLSSNVNTKSEMYELLQANIEEINLIAERILEDNGFSYKAEVYLNREEFPMRVYDGITFPAGEYDALIIRLGEGKGDNWWCVAFPPLCFIGAEDNGTDYFTYKSKIKEILERRG